MATHSGKFPISNFDSIELYRPSVFCKALENAAVGIAICDRRGYFIAANRTYRRITGYSGVELAERRYTGITHPEDVENNLSVARRLYAGEIPQSVYQKRYIRRDGGTVWVRNSASLVHYGREKLLGSFCISEYLGGCRPPENITQDLSEPRVPQYVCCSRYRTAQRLASVVAILSRLERLYLDDAVCREELKAVRRLAIESEEDLQGMLAGEQTQFAEQCSGHLSPRERQVLQLLALGNSNKRCSEILNVGIRTVESHRARLMKKLGLRSVAAITRYAIRNGIVEA